MKNARIKWNMFPQNNTPPVTFMYWKGGICISQSHQKQEKTNKVQKKEKHSILSVWVLKASQSGKAGW